MPRWMNWRHQQNKKQSGRPKLTPSPKFVGFVPYDRIVFIKRIAAKFVPTLFGPKNHPCREEDRLPVRETFL